MSDARESMVEQLRPIFRYVKKYRKMYAIGIAALVGVDILEIFPPLLLKSGVDQLTDQSATSSSLATLALIYVAVALGQAFMRYLWRMFIVRTSMFAADDMRREFFEHLLGLAPGFFRRKRVGDLVSLASNDIQNVRFVLGPTILVFFDAIFYILAIVPVMIYLSPKLALLSLVPLLLVAPFVMKLERMIEKRFLDVQDRFSDLASESQETLGGIRVIKGAALEPLKEKVFGELGKRFALANRRSASAQAALDVGLDFFVSMAITLLFVVGGAQVIGESVTVGTFVAFHLYIQKMTWPMEAIGMTVAQLQRGLVSQSRLNKVYQEKNPISESCRPLKKLRGDVPAIEVKNLSFSYSPESPAVLQGISFRLEPGMRLGIAGAIGSGKSTLLHCLARLEPVADGTIFFDGCDVNELPIAEVRRLIALVPQDSFLFSETVIDNILCGAADLRVRSEAERLSAAQSAAEKAFIAKEMALFPQGYFTKLGERGMNVSGGQRQRITIARALAKDPKLLLFDDCLSAVDSLTERKLTASFADFAQNRTFVFATHRVSSLYRLDKVLVLERGILIDSGDPKILAKSGGAFQGLMEASSHV